MSSNNTEEEAPKKTYSQSQKNAIYRWREKNKDKVKLWNNENNQLLKESRNKWLEKNKEQELIRLRIANNKNYHYKRSIDYTVECKRLRNILFTGGKTFYYIICQIS
jgi:hypothetical protein